MPLSPTPSTVTPSDTVPLPQGYDGTSPFPALRLLALDLPFAAGRLIGGTWRYGLTALLWAGLVRIALVHHVPRNVNSWCRPTVEPPFRIRRHDRATTPWPLAPLSLGESRHNLHHAEPTSADHGVDRGRLAPSAAVVRLLERRGWVHDVRRPSPARVASAAADINHSSMYGSWQELS